MITEKLDGGAPEFDSLHWEFRDWLRKRGVNMITQSACGGDRIVFVGDHDPSVWIIELEHFGSICEDHCLTLTKSQRKEVSELPSGLLSLSRDIIERGGLRVANVTPPEEE